MLRCTVAGIVSGYSGLKLDIEGHTDSVGGDAYNQTLPEKRGGSVRVYLTREGMASDSVTLNGALVLPLAEASTMGLND